MMTKIDCGGITIIFTDEIAEIVIDPAVKPVSAAKLVRILTAAGITAAKIVRTKQQCRQTVGRVRRLILHEKARRRGSRPTGDGQSETKTYGGVDGQRYTETPRC